MSLVSYETQVDCSQSEHQLAVYSKCLVQPSETILRSLGVFATHLVFLLLGIGATSSNGSILSNRIAMKFGGIVLQLNMH